LGEAAYDEISPNEALFKQQLCANLSPHSAAPGTSIMASGFLASVANLPDPARLASL
jgi:hypothetical protein